MAVKYKDNILSPSKIFIIFSFVSTGSSFLTSPVANHIASFADVSATSTCDSDSDGISVRCNNTCPSRTDFPKIVAKPLTNKSDLCGHASNKAELAESSNGNISFSSSDFNCTSVNTSVASVTSGRFTFSVWLKINSSYNSTLFSIGDRLTVDVKQKILLVENKSVGSVETGKWIHIAVRNNGFVDVFVNGQNTNFNRTQYLSKHLLIIGPNKVLTAPERLDMVDARWYTDVLTDREIDSLVTGNFSSLGFESQCRCPDTHPTLYDRGGISCMNRAGNVVSRLNPDSHPPEYMLDGNTSTMWVSGYQQRAEVYITLPQKVQVKRLVLHGLQNNTEKMKIILNGNPFSPDLSGSSAEIDFEKKLFPMSNRSVYEALLGNRIVILFDHSSNTTFTVAEIELNARCPCYGNDENCSINNTALTYTCRCNASSNTSGEFCQTCRDTFFRMQEDNICPYQCGCNLFGSNNEVCMKVGGQCSCKSNVDDASRACDRCKFNTANISSNTTTGCTACSCTPSGISKCMDDFSCQCKKNVETSSGKCSNCLPNYYGIESPRGCSPCDCHEIGTVERESRTCKKDTGQCPCKQYVQGRTCNSCKDEYFNFHKSLPFGCEECKCNIIGRVNNKCNKQNGQCNCRQPVTDNRDCKPSIFLLEPTYGPVAGGTVISIMGELLGDQSVNVRLTLVEVLEYEKNDSVIFARTKRHRTAEEVPITIVWTKGNSTYKNDSLNLKFTFKENPTVTVPNEIFKTFASGGCAVDIYGEKLDNVPHPQLFIYTESNNISTKWEFPAVAFQSSDLNTASLIQEAKNSCVSKSSSQISCLSPAVDTVSEINVTYGVGLDNIQNYSSFSASETVISIFPDPNITTNQMIEFRNTFDDTITIKGNGLNTACRDSDVKILIDNITCSLISRADMEIICDPQEGFPGTTREATLMLSIGNLKVEVGKVNFVSFWKTTEFYIIIGSVCGGILVVLVIIVSVLICLRRRKQQEKPINGIEMTPAETERSRRPNSYVIMQPGEKSVAAVAPVQSPENHSKAFIKRLPSNVAKAVKTSVIDKRQIEIGRHCTQKGGLIRVINGQFITTSSSPFAGTPLTIKTLIDPYEVEDALPSWLTGGLLECTRLRDNINENVLQLLGITIDDKNIYILYQEMSNRSLKEYMHGYSSSISQEKRLAICKQVAEGMNFLDSEHIVHKDLAARNCWVDSNEIVKIGDSSFSWDLYPDDYLLQYDRYMPVRWMAPESLKQPGFYSSKTDVWSYGVLMWEVFTNCCIPYHDIEDDTLIKEFVCEKGYRLGKPLHCSEIIYKVIEICQKEYSQDRPNFFIILNHLSEITAGNNPKISYLDQQNMDDEDQIDYMNVSQLKGIRRH